MKTNSGMVETHIAERIMEITLLRPERKNALNLAMYRDLAAAITLAGADDTVRVILLRGADGCFTSGNDLADFANSPEILSGDNPVVAFMVALSQFPKPVVVAVEGVAVGIGTTLLLHCDLAYAHADASFRLPFVNLGLCPEYASSWLLPRLVGHAKAAEWLLLGENFGAEEALAAGLINAVVDDPVAFGREQARKLAMQPPTAIRITKALMKQGIAASVDLAMKRELDQFAKALNGQEFRTAVAAFFDKRK